MIRRGERCYLDSNALIAIFERSTPLDPGQRGFLLAIGDGSVWCVTSELAVAECLVKPLRDENDDLAGLYLDFIDNQLSARPVQIDRFVLTSAARARGKSNMKPPDALHVAAAQIAGCEVFVSEDKGIRLPASMRRVGFLNIAVEEE